MSNHERIFRDLDDSPGAVDEHVVDMAHPVSLSVNVLFTTVPVTLEVLREAGRLAVQRGLHIRVLVPSVVPYPLDLDRPRVDPLFRLRHFRTLWHEQSVETSVEVLLCRDRLGCIRDALAPHSLILMGARSRPWPSDRRLINALRKDGHDVMLFEGKLRKLGRFSPLRLIERLAFGIEHDNLTEIQALHSRFNLRGVSHQQK